MTQVVMVRGRAITKSRVYTLAVLCLLMAVAAAINLGIGINLSCAYDSYCDYSKNAYIIAGSCFVASSICFLIAAISLHIRLKKAMRLNQSSPTEQTVTISPQYPVQPVVFATTPTQYPTSYPLQTGPTPYVLSPPANEYPPQIGFAVQTQPTQPYPGGVTQPTQPYPGGVTQPPPYSP